MKNIFLATTLLLLAFSSMGNAKNCYWDRNCPAGEKCDSPGGGAQGECYKP